MTTISSSPIISAQGPLTGAGRVTGVQGLNPASGGDPGALVSVQPSSGLVGSKLNVSGSGFLPSANLTIFFNGTRQSRIVPTTPTPCVTNDSGSFTCFTRVPALPAGTYDVNVTDNVTNGSATYTILSPTLALAPSAGFVMSNVTANGSGFSPGIDVTLLFNSTSIADTNCTSGSSLLVNSSGNFTCTFATPPLTTGAYAVSASDDINSATSTFTILRPALALNRTSGYVDSTVIAVGAGYIHNAMVKLVFGSHNISSCTAGSLQANDSGAFNCTYKVPVITAGRYHVRAFDNVSSSPSILFTIGPPLLSVSPDQGFVGNSTTATGAGFAHSILVSLTFGAATISDSDCVAGSLSTGHTGAFSCTFLVPPSTAGNHTVQAKGNVNNATANYTVIPHLNLSQPNGSFGAEVTATVTGFGPSASVDVAWNSSYTLCSGATDSNGSASCSFLVPTAPLGGHAIKASEASNTSTALFQVTPSVSLSATSQIVGYTLTASGYGFNPLTSISVFWDHITPQCPGSVTDTNGAAVCSFSVPGAPGGTHTVTFVQGALEVNVSFTILLWFSIAPTAGVVGTNIVLSGTGFGASTTYLACLQVEPEYCSTGTPFTTGSNGTIPSGTVFTVPSESPGEFYLVVSIGTSVADAQAFNVTVAIVTPSPGLGPVGTSISLTGSKFAPDTNYAYCFQIQASACPSGVRTQFESTSSGTIPSGIAPLDVPADPAGFYYVDVSNGTDLIGVHTFDIVSNLTGSINLGAVGTRVTATATGFAASTHYSLTWNASVQLCSGASNNLGGFTCQFVIPFAVAGFHQINATAADTAANFSFDIVPLLALSPDSGTVGSTVHATGTGFNALASFSLYWNTSFSSCIGSTNFSGGFSCTFDVPSAPAGIHGLEAAEGGLTNLSPFTVLPSLAAAPGSGPVGSTGFLTGQGFAASAAYTVLWSGSVVLCSGATNDTGAFGCSFIVPVTAGGATTILAVQVPNSITTEFTVTPSVTVSPHEGTVGSRVETVAQGLDAGAGYTLSWNSSASVCGGTASSVGQYFCNFTVPVAPAGTHDLTGNDGGSPFTVAFVVIPSSSISETSGTVNTTVELLGEGFDASAPFAVDWNASTILCSGTTQSNGNLSCAFVVPSTPGGLHLVKITEGSFELTSSFTIDASLSISPKSATVGSVVTVSGFGFAAVSTYSVSWTAGGVLCSGSTNGNGAFVCAFTIPSVAPGNYTVTGTQGNSALTITITVSSSTPPPVHTTTTPFPWWIVAVLAVGGLVGAVAIYYRYGRRPSARPRPVQPWDESVPPTGLTGPSGGELEPVPLSPATSATMVGSPSGGMATGAAGAGVATAAPPEDVDALIARLDRIAEQMFKRKSGPDLEPDQSEAVAEDSR